MADEELNEELESDLDDALEPEDVDESTEDEEEGEPSLEEKLKEVIDVSADDVGALRKKLTITVPHDAIGERFDEQYDELRSEAVVPGFRKGRAPRRLLEKRFGREVGEQLVQQIVGASYAAATDKLELKVLGDPMIWAREKGAESDTLLDFEKALPLMALPEGDEPFTYACEVEIRPEFDLPELDNIPVRKPVVTVTDDDVSGAIDRMLRYQGRYVAVPDGTVQEDDLVVADIKMTSGDTELKQQNDVRLSARGQVIDGVTLENLGEILAGAKAGDVRTITGTIPDDYVKTEFREKPVEFEFAIREVQRLNVPQLTEEFIQNMGYESEDELRGYIRSDLESRTEEQARQAMRGQIHDYLLDKTEMPLPERVSQRQEARMLVGRMYDLYRQGVPQTDVDKMMDELRTSAKDEAARELKRFFIMERLSEEIEVDVSESEINNVIASIAMRQGRRFDRVRDEFAREGGMMNLYLQLRDEKIIEQLLEKAQVTEAEPESTPGKKAPAKGKTAGKKPAGKKGEADSPGADDLSDKT